jgi:hypothetical protein
VKEACSGVYFLDIFTPVSLRHALFQILIYAFQAPEIMRWAKNMRAGVECAYAVREVSALLPLSQRCAAMSRGKERQMLLPLHGSAPRALRCEQRLRQRKWRALPPCCHYYRHARHYFAHKERRGSHFTQQPLIRHAAPMLPGIIFAHRRRSSFSEPVCLPLKFQARYCCFRHTRTYMPLRSCRHYVSLHAAAMPCRFQLRRPSAPPPIPPSPPLPAFDLFRLLVEREYVSVRRRRRPDAPGTAHAIQQRCRRSMPISPRRHY